MKTTPCETSSDSKLLSYEEMLREEGVYRVSIHIPQNKTRLIVIKVGSSSILPYPTFCLYYDGLTGKLEPANGWYNSHYKFIKTDETVKMTVS